MALELLQVLYGGRFVIASRFAQVFVGLGSSFSQPWFKTVGAIANNVRGHRRSVVCLEHDMPDTLEMEGASCGYFAEFSPLLDPIQYFAYYGCRLVPKGSEISNSVS
jgi:hypothetical protein